MDTLKIHGCEVLIDEMSDKTNTANSLKERERRRRQVLKPILDNPLTTVNWPFIEPDIAKNIIQHLCLILNQIGNYKKIVKDSTKPSDAKDIINKIVIGFNDTTKQLEDQAKGIHKGASIKYVIVCKYDLTPSILTQHFPVLSYTATKGSNTPVKLIQLPRGTIDEISSALGEKTGVLGLKGDIPHADALYEILDTIADVKVPYLDDEEFQKLQIRFLSTTAPIGNPKNDQKSKNKLQHGQSNPKTSNHDSKSQKHKPATGKIKKVIKNSVK